MLDNILLYIAKLAILTQFDETKKLSKNDLTSKYSYLQKQGASFVTLKYDGELRGCIGSIVSHRTLYDDIVHNAIASGFKDPRFKPLHVEELSSLNIEVSVLSEPKLLQYNDFEDLCKKLRPHVDGIILKHDIYQSTFLPQVWEQLQSPKLFLEHLALKAGSSLAIYEVHPEIYIYQVDAIQENFDAILSD